MTKIRALFVGLFCVVVLATNLMAAAPLLHSTGEVGTCLPGYAHLGLSINTAVTLMAPGGFLYICPGTYQEQVTVSIPLNLIGVKDPASTADSVVITSPSPIPANTTDLTSGAPVAAQLLVYGVTPPGPVNISNLTVDGNNNGLPGGCGGANLVGIY